MSLEGKIAVVTGGCGGLGQSIASKLIAQGAVVVITDLDDTRGNAVAEELGCRFFKADVSQADDWAALVDMLNADYQGLDILVNNAAILRADNIEDETLENFNRVMSVNCNSVFIGTQACLPLMKGRDASIVNISSSSSLMGFPQFCAYTASKSAVRSLTMSTAVHCKQQGYKVRCNSVHPDGIFTPMVMDIPGTPVQLPQDKAMLAASFGSPPDAIADVVLFLASDASRQINGAAISADNTSTIYPPYL